MLKILIYMAGVATGAGLLMANQWYARREAGNARSAAYRECETRERERNEAYRSGYKNASRHYRNMSDAERFAETFEGRRTQFRAH